MKSLPSPPGRSPSLPKLSRVERVVLVILPLLLLVLICALNFPKEFHLHGLASLGTAAFAGFANLTSPGQPDFRLLMGVLTFADRFEQRQRLRILHSLQPPVTAQIEVKFVFCNLTKDEQRVLVALEIMLYDDIIILHCRENGNNGKTYAFFSILPELFKGTNGNGKPYDYVMKTDDDTYFRFPQMVASLKWQPREDLYWGSSRPAHSDKVLFMAGMGYVLSWDLVEWIAASDKARDNTIGPEDALVGEWLREGGRGKRTFDTKPEMYDFWEGHLRGDDTICVHRLKNSTKWAYTLRHFNVTDGLKPSKFYHLH